MVLIYGSNEQRSSGGFIIPISQWGTPAVMKTWQTHLENRSYLFFMYTKGTYAEKQQASKELEICDRKLAFWERHPAFDISKAASAKAQVKSKWNSR